MIRTVIAACAAALLLASCSTPTSTASTDKYKQTWTKQYAQTTCTDWSASMTAGQRFAASADMLAGARNKGDGGKGLPPDSLIDKFQEAVTNACVIPTATITDVAVGVYLTHRATYRP